MAFFTYEANKSRVFINGVELFLLSDIRCSDDYALEAISGIGNVHVKQHVPTVARHQFTLNGYMERNEKTIRNNIIPENGDVALRGRTFSVEIFDREGPLLRRYEEAMCNDVNASMSAHRLMMKGATFHATDVKGPF